MEAVFATDNWSSCCHSVITTIQLGVLVLPVFVLLRCTIRRYVHVTSSELKVLSATVISGKLDPFAPGRRLKCIFTKLSCSMCSNVIGD